MKATKFIAAAAVFVAAGSAFAADASPAASTAATSAAAVAVASTSDKLNVPSIQISSPLSRDRADVKAEAVEFVKNHKTAFAVQLEQYKN